MSTGKRALSQRKRPRQARAKQTVEWVLIAAARVFRREGFAATTNRIAEEAGVSVGSLYEYFPNKQALLATLAERHVLEAETGIARALAEGDSIRGLLTGLQAAIAASHRYPSQALEFVADAGLDARVGELRQRVLGAIETSLERERPELAPRSRELARVALGTIGTLTSQMTYTAEDEIVAKAYAEALLDMTARYLEQHE